MLLIALWALEERKCHFSAKGITRKENRPMYLKKEALIFLDGPRVDTSGIQRRDMTPRFQQTMACNFSEPLVELMERMPDSVMCRRMVCDTVALSCRLVTEHLLGDVSHAMYVVLRYVCYVEWWV